MRTKKSCIHYSSGRQTVYNCIFARCYTLAAWQAYIRPLYNYTVLDSGKGSAYYNNYAAKHTKETAQGTDRSKADYTRLTMALSA